MDFNHYLHTLFNPRSVAIVGASARSGSFGTLIWKIAKSASPRAKLFPVNPKYKTIGRETSYAALTDIKEDVDKIISDDDENWAECYLEFEIIKIR